MPIIQDDEKQDDLYRIRHSLSHVLAQAVQELFPGTILGFGPPIRDGFYYDFILPEAITDKDLARIEKQMRKIIRQNQAFEQRELAADEAFTLIEQTMKEPHKLEYARELVEKHGNATIGFYTNGPFLDMCEGPHVANTSELPLDGFKLHAIAAAYWRGDERNATMTRIYGYAYPDKQQLRARIQEVETARKNDHRKIAQQQHLYVINEDVGRGLPLWLPNGTVLRDELEQLARETEFRYGYKRVATPHITKRGLYETSGHIPLYEETMYPPMVVDDLDEEGVAKEAYYLKPMNCPHHHMVYAAEPRSYRDLPLRLAEYGTVYRFERGGQLQGITRVRGMGMNDAHIYVTPEQLKDEFKAVMQLHKEYYDLFEFDNYYLRLSLWDPEDPKRQSKYVDDPPAWAKTEALVQEALEELGLYYRLSKGEAAFYGPKVDFQFSTVLEREFTVSTNQVDFAVPPRFNLTYVDRDGTEKTPYCIHRAPLGTHERFIAFLVEHYGGAFPLWLSPIQVAVLSVSDKSADYARTVHETLRKDLIRSELDDSDERIGKKVRTAAKMRVPVILVVGEAEAEGGHVTVRRRGVEAQREMTLDTLVPTLKEEIGARRVFTDWDDGA